MASPPSNFRAAGAVVVDANILIASTSKEPVTSITAGAALQAYSASGWQFYAPGVLIAETLFGLCRKLQDGLMSPVAHAAALVSFDLLLRQILPPPGGDASLMLRAEQIRQNYGCSRSADGIYLALAEQLSAFQPTRLLTLDADLAKQAARNAPSVIVDLLT